MKKTLCILLILSLMCPLLPAATAQDVILPVEPIDDEPAFDALEAGESLLFPEASEAVPQVLEVDPAANGAGQAVPNYTSGNLAHFVHPTDGEVLEPGDVEIWLTYDDDGLFDEEGHLMVDDWSTAAANYMPTYLGITKDGVLNVHTIRNNNIDFNGASRCYATVTLNEPGTYTLSVASSRGRGDPETITVTVAGGATPAPSPVPPGENPGYHLIPEQTEYTINLAREKQVRFNFSIQLYRPENQFWWGFTQDSSDIITMADKDHSELTLTQKGDVYACDTYIVFEGLKVGTTSIDICVTVNGVDYDTQTITFHVIDDPGPTPSPTPGPTPSAAPTQTAEVVKTPTPTPAPQSIKSAKVANIPAKTYTGKAIKPKPTVKAGGQTLVRGRDYTLSWKNNKAIGTATVVVKGIGAWTGTIKKSFTINPRPVSLSKLTPGKGRLTATWKKGAGGVSYTIQYSRYKDFRSAKAVTAKKGAVRKVLKQLTRGKRFYVRIRAWKKVNGKTYVSKWSKVKSAKVK